MNAALFSTAYLPSIFYLSKIIAAQNVVIENHENFVKQTYRNRCEIYSSNGKQTLSIPLIKQADKELICNKKISYAEDWQRQHWRAITSAYKNSAYFEFFEDDLKPFYETKYEYLIEYNTQLLKAVLQILRIKKEITLSTSYEALPSELLDFRNLSEPGNIQTPDSKIYYQVFAQKHGFINNLSCLDALFHTGLNTQNLFN